MRFPLPPVIVALAVAVLAPSPSFAESDSHEGDEGFADLTDEVVTSTAEDWNIDSSSLEAPATQPINNGGGGSQVRDRPPIRMFGDIAQSSCPPGESRVEVFWVDPDTGDVTDHEGFRCMPYSQIENDDATAPRPASAEAPARDSVSEAIPDRVVRVNPHPRGMTGMETWLWYDDDGDETTPPTTELDVTASVPGMSVTSTAAITSYCWDVDGDGSDEVCTDAPGTEEHPAFTHVYESTGTYQVRLTVTWGGSFSVNGAPPVAFDPVQRTYTVDYEVIEVRSVLTG